MFLQALMEEVGRRFADLTAQEKEIVSLAVSAICIKVIRNGSTSRAAAVAGVASAPNYIR